MNETTKEYYKEIIRLLKKVDKITELADKVNGHNNADITTDMMITRVAVQTRLKSLENSLFDFNEHGKK